MAPFQQLNCKAGLWGLPQYRLVSSIMVVCFPSTSYVWASWEEECWGPERHGQELYVFCDGRTGPFLGYALKSERLIAATQTAWKAECTIQAPLCQSVTNSSPCPELSPACSVTFQVSPYLSSRAVCSSPLRQRAVSSLLFKKHAHHYS